MTHPPEAAAQPGPGRAALAAAWAGGAAFVASLLLFVYCYGVRYGRAGSDRVLVPLVVDVLLFSAFALHHSLFARTGIKIFVRRIFPPWMERSLFTWVASGLFAAVLLAWRPVDGLLYELAGPWRWLGFGAQLAGLVVTAAGSSAIDVLDLAGVRPVLDAGRQQSPRHVPLETGGLYAFVRHPLYFGWMLMVGGAPVMTGTRAVFAVVSTVYLALAIPFEERSLVQVFGDRYRAYQQRTRWRMLPGIW